MKTLKQSIPRKGGLVYLVVLLLVLGLSGVGVYTYVAYQSSGGAKNVSSSGASGSKHTVDFNEDIRPIFNKNCVDCHGGIKQKGGMNVLYRSELLKKGESGNPAVVPGHPEKSELIARVTSDDPQKRMPYKKEPLSKEEIKDLKTWIRQGAKWEKHWAYQKVEKVSPPSVKNDDWVRNEIDRFVLSRLREKGYEPSERAECHTLVRRLSLDVRGIPPSMNDVRSYCENQTAEQYEKLVDKYLADKNYGERWTTMWLDLARYADSKGYEADRLRTMWKYRDWVIRAFNNDKPFDQFTIEQLAGDLLEDPSRKQLLATAYHRNTMTNTEGGTKDEEFRVAAIINRVNNTMEVWQGGTMQCVQCHSHPYEPIKHNEFYEFYAFFNNTVDRDLDKETPSIPGLRPDHPKYPFVKSEEKQKKATRLYNKLKKLRARLDAMAYRPKYQKKLKTWVKKARKQLKETENRDVAVRKISPKSPLEKIINMPREQRTPNQHWQLVRHWAYYSKVTDYAPELENIVARIDKYKKKLKKLDTVDIPVMRELPEKFQRITRIFNRGNFRTKGEQVTPDTPEILNDFPDTFPQNRLGLAKWLVHPDNPLTSRVTVNRFWNKIFGRGIVKTPGNFTSRGRKPTHPKLLDWLAHQFMHDFDWSMKTLVKKIVMSATYRQSSKMPEKLAEADPNNKWLARGPRFRLSAEQVRDQALDVAGLLSDRMYGPPVYPPQPDGIWNSVYADYKWKTDKGEDRYRRGVYTFFRRSAPYPSFQTFDAPSRRNTCSRRIRTNTPLQALVTLNDPVYVEAARALAGRMNEVESGRVKDQVKQGYQMALFHPPSDRKLKELVRLYNRSLSYYKDNKKEAKKFTGVGQMKPGGPHEAALTSVANTILNLDAFLMKQ